MPEGRDMSLKRVKAPRRLVWREWERENRKAIEASRSILMCGCTLLGHWPSDVPLDSILGELGRMAADPSIRQTAPWTGYSPIMRPPFSWDAGETLALWHAGQIVALLRRSEAGELVVCRRVGVETWWPV
jgi:hypothetical protein